MELRHLRYFVAVAEAGSVTHAAAKLNMQQPPLSQQIAFLEAELGVKLFDRVAKRMQLNPAGRQFLEDARATLAAANTAIARVRRFDRGEQGHVAAGFTSSASLHHLVPRIIQDFRAAYPLATLDVAEAETFELLQAVDQKRLDVAFVRTTSTRFESLASDVLHQEEFMAVLPRSHPLSSQTDPLPLNELMQDRLVLYRRPDGVGIFDVLNNAFRDAGHAPHIAETVTRIIAAINLVAAGQGISFVPESMQVLHPSSVTYHRLLPGSLPPMPLLLITRAADQSALVRNFVETARQTQLERIGIGPKSGG